MTNLLRRRVAARQLPAHVATSLLSDLASATITLHPFEPFGERVWDLRDNLTAYDAWYLALAETHGCRWPRSIGGWSRRRSRPASS